MRILLLGSGGREHAFAWKIAQSAKCSKLWIAPGNAGTSSCGENVSMAVDDFDMIGAFCREQKVEMLVVGPEVPLVKGIVDYFQADSSLADIAVIGPNAKAAQLEGSKAFAKEFLFRHGIPTAGYKKVTAESLQEGLDYLEKHPMPVVLKADGLAAGKGVLICSTKEEAQSELSEMLTQGKFGEAGASVVIEEFLDGLELSVFALTDSKHYVLFPTSKDYKRVGEGDSGLNTGGMGAISPVPFADRTLMDKIIQQVVDPTIAGLQKDGIEYRGFIYFGLIRVNGEPFVIEYNCRMGDPETQAVLPLLENDLVALFESVAKGNVDSHRIAIKQGTAATVIMASGGYPGSYQKGKSISGLGAIADSSMVFHAGTATKDDQVVTSGGRVLAVTSIAADMRQALSTSYGAVSAIKFEGGFYRSDIGFDLFRTD